MAKTIADVAPEAVLLAGAGRAILLQLANPAVGYGVARHSDFAANPLKRLHHTLQYIYALSNGTVQQRRAVQAHVQRAHLPVKSTGDAHTPAYDASDGQLQLWVAATLYDSARHVHAAVFPPLSDDDDESVYQSYAVLGEALGMPAGLWPATRADFDKYWERQLAQLSVDGTVSGVARELLAARRAPPWLKPLMPLARFLSVGLLPGSVRELYGFSWPPRRERLLRILLATTSQVVRILPASIRQAPMRYYLKRLG